MSEHDAVLAQRRAADPQAAAWVAANAGSGKTRVLTERVARLLLSGARPEKILCLTYTKAAAAEMQNRLFAMLGGWAMATDERLREDLKRLTGFGAPDDLDRARRLFAEALETPGGLKIQTIHAFCDSLLRRFPLEAGAPPEFRTMETREQDDLIAETLNEMAADEGRDGPLAGVAAFLNEDSIAELAAEVVKRRDLFPPAIDDATFAEAFGTPAPPDPAAARLNALAALDRSALNRMIAAWDAGAKTDKERAQTLAEARDRGDPDLALDLPPAMLTQAGEPRAKPASKNAQAAEPDWEAFCAHLAEIALAIREADLAAHAADRALRLARFGGALATRYEFAKSQRSLLDFDDLVGKARALLTRSEAREWALYKLDGGVEHILVDEAQDTSPAQWDVIVAIAEEFGAGIGVHERRRTSFVVGDEKQSIYSFQGAAPGKFDEMRGRFGGLFAPVGGLTEEALKFSFRSAPAILKTVDAVFAEDRAKGLTAAGAPAEHAAFHGARAGRVELWPLIEPSPEPDEPPSWAPVDMPGPSKPRMVLADAVADYAAELIDGGRLPGGGRLIEPGDIIILLRARAPMMAAIIRRLKQRGAPVAGADRLLLGDELAVKDLLALMRVATTPGDDLSLAALLRSPLCGVDEAGLFELAHSRDSRLIDALRGARNRWPEEAGLIDDARGTADFLRPYEFLERVLVRHDGRRRLLSRLGPEAEDPIDELLAQALAYEQAETPSVTGFLAWMSAGAAEIKREQEPARPGERGEIRVMSAHGAKGLEAPVVILPDTMRPAEGRDRGHVVEIETAQGSRAAWRAPSGSEPALLSRAKERAKAEAAAEHRRLLYVAMTRAEDWLIVAGAGEMRDGRGEWYDLVRQGFAGLPTRTEPSPTGAGDTLIFEEDGEPKAGRRGPPAAAPKPAAPPQWLEANPALDRPARERKAASELLRHGDEPQPAAGATPELARLRGVAIHEALELETDDPAAVARVIGGFDLPAIEALSAAAEATAARALPEAAMFFGPDALAEAGVAVTTGRALVSGRIDRLLVEPKRVSFVDFKSDAAPPSGPDHAPEAYLAQLGAYAAALSKIYPDREIAAYLLWTAAPRLDRLDAGRMAEALMRATGPSAS